jgi:hypothetical protein
MCGAQAHVRSDNAACCQRKSLTENFPSKVGTQVASGSIPLIDLELVRASDLLLRRERNQALAFDKQQFRIGGRFN